MDFLSPSMVSQLGDHHVLAGERKYVDGSVLQLALDEQGNNHYDGRTGDSRRTRSSGRPGRACGFRRRMTERVDLRLSSRQIV